VKDTLAAVRSVNVVCRGVKKIKCHYDRSSANEIFHHVSTKDVPTLVFICISSFIDRALSIGDALGCSGIQLVDSTFLFFPI
jgi:hypothetical protein